MTPPAWLFAQTTNFTALLIAAIVVAGVVIGPFLAKLAELRYERRRRERREMDMAIALRAEISAGRERVIDQAREPEANYLLANEYPFGPSDRTDFVFESLKGEIVVLPQAVIESVVRYYKLAEQSNRLIDYLLKDQYLQQGPDERRKYAQNIIAALKDQDNAAMDALIALSTFMGSRHRAAAQPMHEDLRWLDGVLNTLLIAALLVILVARP